MKIFGNTEEEGLFDIFILEEIFLIEVKLKSHYHIAWGQFPIFRNKMHFCATEEGVKSKPFLKYFHVQFQFWLDVEKGYF